MACFVRSQNLDPGDVYKSDHSILDNRICLFSHSTTESNRDLRYDVFKLPYDVYFQSEYRDAIKATASIDWGCSTCDAPQFGITALSEISPDACLYILGTRAWSPGCLQK